MFRTSYRKSLNEFVEAVVIKSQAVVLDRDVPAGELPVVHFSLEAFMTAYREHTIAAFNKAELAMHAMLGTKPAVVTESNVALLRAMWAANSEQVAKGEQPLSKVTSMPFCTDGTGEGIRKAEEDGNVDWPRGSVEVLEARRVLLVSGTPDVTEHFTCAEVEALAVMFRAAGAYDLADKWIASHAAGDEEGDQHYVAPQVSGLKHNDAVIGDTPMTNAPLDEV